MLYYGRNKKVLFFLNVLVFSLSCVKISLIMSIHIQCEIMGNVETHLGFGDSKSIYRFFFFLLALLRYSDLIDYLLTGFEYSPHDFGIISYLHYIWSPLILSHFSTSVRLICLLKVGSCSLLQSFCNICSLHFSMILFFRVACLLPIFYQLMFTLVNLTNYNTNLLLVY